MVVYQPYLRCGREDGRAGAPFGRRALKDPGNAKTFTSQGVLVRRLRQIGSIHERRTERDIGPIPSTVGWMTSRPEASAEEAEGKDV
jgi:hypothetical protein